MTTSDSVIVIIYCTVCGNRSTRDRQTGALREGLVRMSRAMIDEVRKGVCLYCRGAMGAHIVHDANEGRS